MSNRDKRWQERLADASTGVWPLVLVLAAAGASRGLAAEDRVVAAEAGTVGILGGATLLEVGGAAVPIALAVLVAGVVAERLVRELIPHPGGTHV